MDRIKDASGDWKETPDEIRKVIEEYFGPLFTASNLEGKLSERESVKQVSKEDNENLMAEVTWEEVKYAVFSIHPDKSSGPDGLNPAFFQAFWNIVEGDVTKFCRNFVNTGVLPEGINISLVCLIPKVKAPKTMGDLRPISLCNVFIRIISKVMTNRLKTCLGTIISDKQSAFIEGRSLTDNVLIAFEVNHYMRRRTQGSMGIAGLKLDVSKAYDRLEWAFIRSMMERFGFHHTWINRIMTFISSVTYCFLHNGEQFGYVVPSRGVRQGDPISPYIYIMCVEGLSSIIRRNEEAGLLHGCRIATGAPVISHLLFADDCYLFFKANKVEANVMKRILDRYADISGQIINYNKSAITFSPNTRREDRTEVCLQLGVQEQDKPGKYLGMPMFIGRKKSSVFAFLVDRVESKLQTWNAQNISKAGKVTLLKTAAQSIPNFWMNLLLIPLDVCETIERKMNAYWWGGGRNQKGIRWMSWDRLCDVRVGGGLSFKKLRDFNISMLAKQAWRPLWGVIQALCGEVYWQHRKW